MIQKNIGTIILKPTKFCNAECTYCSAPYEDATRWSLDTFKSLVDNVAPYLAPGCDFIWHGGEPMLMGPEFYRKAYGYMLEKKLKVNFSIQTNILLYTSSKWKAVFSEIMGGRISTSYDYKGDQRLLKGDAGKYDAAFWKAMNAMKADGFDPLVIGTYEDSDVPAAKEWFDQVSALGVDGFPLRFNYKYPAGRAKGQGELMSPENYLDLLKHTYDGWVALENPEYEVVPVSQMLRKVIGMNEGQCPWTDSCGGHFMGIEPNGDVYNCSEYADLDDIRNSFGNIFSQPMSDIVMSKAMKRAKRRSVSLPSDCLTCDQFHACRGGCMREADLYGNGQFGKAYYCHTWYGIFKHIKESVLSGEADHLLRRYGAEPVEAKRFVKMNMNNLNGLDSVVKSSSVNSLVSTIPVELV